MCLDGLKVKGHLFAPISFKSGIQNDIPGYFGRNNFFKLENINDYENVLKRLSKIPDQLLTIKETLEIGIRENMTFALESMTRVKGQFDKLQVKNVEKSLFYHPFRNLKNTEPEREIREKAIKLITEDVLPAFQDLSDFVQNVYMNHLRPEAGVWSMANGKEFYQKCLEYHTTLDDIDAEKVHQIGLENVDQLRKGVEQLARSMNLNMNFSSFVQYARDLESLKFKTQDEGLKLFKDILENKINPKLSQVFSEDFLTNPNIYRLNVDLPDKGSGATAYYSNADPKDKTSNSTFYVNLNDLSIFQKTIATTLTLHEANPGHHFQFVYQTIADFPKYLSYTRNVHLSMIPSQTPLNTAHTEGWALYAEYLGLELGLFDEDPFQKLGFYSYNLLRSARLVVDTGIHHFGWSRQKAIDYLLANTAFSLSYIELQVDRYITWPGQATAYKMGEQAIRNLRAKLEKEEDFDIKQFHTDVLTCYGPMNLLEDCVRIQMKAKM